MSEKTAAKLLDAEIKRKAKEMILDVCRSMDLTDTENFKTIESKTGEIEFHFTSSSEMGKAIIQYSPQPYVEKLLMDFNNRAEAKAGDEDWRDVPPTFIEEWSEKAVFRITKILIYNFQYECFGFVYNQPRLAMECFGFLKPLFYERESKRTLLQTDTERNEQIEKILENLSKYRKVVILGLEKQVLAQISAPQFIFCDIYDINWKVWKKAKAFYTRNKKLANALDIVKKTFPNLDEDLIDKFDKQGEGEPAALAFKSAARYLNIPPDKGTNETSRKNYLAQSRIQRNSASAEEVDEAYKKYVLAWQDYYQTNDRWRQMSLDFIKKLLAS
ncbi:MAG: hypothetical protein M3367_06575 [Acidobacteriota bacterium]|nr:hypothetical protein [Acidobacteriota bacterium]